MRSYLSAVLRAAGCSAALFFLCLAYAEAPHKVAFAGVGSCSSSVCHGSVTARQGSNILHNEYVSWQKTDKHSRAWTVLLESDSRRIAHHLGIERPEENSQCLACHSTKIPDPEIGSQDNQYKDGVGCESCHGAAKDYLKSHAEKSAKHSDNVANGLKDIVNLQTRANMCLECHLGSSKGEVTHRLIGAGHPRLTFELDTFGIAQPYHWIVDNDYISRKSEYNPTRAWLIGQNERAHQILLMADSKIFGARTYPELSGFYCYSCHHSLAEKQWKSREYAGTPGELRLNLSSLMIVHNALEVLEPALANKLGLLLRNLHQGAPKVSYSEFKEVAKFLASVQFDEKTYKKLFRSLIVFGQNDAAIQYEVAEQVAMGISSILSTGSFTSQSLRGSVERMYSALGQPDSFDPSAFKAALVELSNRAEE